MNGFQICKRWKAWDTYAWTKDQKYEMNGRTNAGHIYRQKNGPESYKPGLSDASKNIKIEQVMGAKIMEFTSISPWPKAQKLEMQLCNQYWAHLQTKIWSWKL